jgi:hypothetical protein
MMRGKLGGLASIFFSDHRFLIAHRSSLAHPGGSILHAVAIIPSQLLHLGSRADF